MFRKMRKSKILHIIIHSTILNHSPFCVLELFGGHAIQILKNVQPPSQKKADQVCCRLNYMPRN